MSEQAPAVSLISEEYEISDTLWNTLRTEIQRVSVLIDKNEPLDPDDFTKVRSLRTQVDEYVTAFNRQLRVVQENYKEQVRTQLTSLGYSKIENYIVTQRQIQTQTQSKRISDKMEHLSQILKQALKQTPYVEQSCLGNNVLSLFVHRFPKINSGAKSNEIKNWGPYKQVIETNLQMVEAFLSDSDFPQAHRLPLSSKTMQQICTYLKTGELDALRTLRTMYQNDESILKDMYLRDNITSQELALSLIQDVIASTSSVSDKMNTIDKIMSIAKNMPVSMESEKK